MVYFDMFIVIRFITTSLSANVTGERPRPAVHPHVFRQIVTPMKRLTTIWHFAHKLLGHLVLLHVSLAIIFPDELTAAVVTRVRSHRLVSVHM